jgi:hypothetical protein
MRIFALALRVLLPLLTYQAKLQVSVTTDQASKKLATIAVIALSRNTMHAPS